MLTPQFIVIIFLVLFVLITLGGIGLTLAVNRKGDNAHAASSVVGVTILGDVMILWILGMYLLSQT